MKSLATTLTPVANWDKKTSEIKASKKKPNPILLVLVVLLIVLVGSAIFRASHHAPTEQFVQVVTCNRDVPPGVRLGLMNLRFLPVPKNYVTDDMVTSLNYAADSVARTYIAQGEPISRVQLFGKKDTLANVLETHERAITLQMNDDALIDHCLNPDDRVDVLCVSSNKDGQKFTRTIAVDARVLMCVPKEQLLARRLGNASANMVTLAVTPDLTEAISEAVEVGKIRLVLRNRLTRVEPHLKGVGPDDLLPASAFLAKKDEVLPANAAVPGAPSLPVIAPPDLKPVETNPNSPENALSAITTAQPVQWMIEMFSGSHKDVCGVPAK
ncbi:MAG: Flp pilus assembly protein CpaB [Cyanobacteria bacterium REEB67]|nr:Flp pilus assembly protein CpaB [Cyanobacteria bacterium REEB67]